MSELIIYKGIPYCITINCDIINYTIIEDKLYINIFDHDLHIKRTLEADLIYYTYLQLIKDIKNVR